MFDLFSFRTKLHIASAMAKGIQEREDYEAVMVQEKQEEAELHNALKENHSIEQKQEQIVSKDLNQQKLAEQALASSVRFPKDEAFRQKMKNAQLYAILLLKGIEQKKKEKRTIARSVQNIINWQRQDRKKMPKDGRSAFCRFYLRNQLWKE